MQNQQTFGAHSQRRPPNGIDFLGSVSFRRGYLLGNDRAQLPRREYRTLGSPNLGATHESLSREFEPADRLNVLKKQRFTPEDKESRVARSLAALYQAVSIRLKPNQWRHIAEDIDVEDQF